MTEWIMKKEGKEICPRCKCGILIALDGERYTCSLCESEFIKAKDHSPRIKEVLSKKGLHNESKTKD